MIDFGSFKLEYLTERVVKKKIEVLNEIENNLIDGKFEAEIIKNYLCNAFDLDQLKLLWACKYVDKDNKEVAYDSKCQRRQLLVAKDLELLKKNNFLNDLFEKGTKADINLIIATDTTKNISIILDGVHRITTLYSMYLDKQEYLEDLLFCRRFKIELTEIKSPIASNLFPHDFQMIHS